MSLPQPLPVAKADRQVPYRVIDEVLERLRQAGAENVSLLSQAEPPG